MIPNGAGTIDAPLADVQHLGGAGGGDGRGSANLPTHPVLIVAQPQVRELGGTGGGDFPPIGGRFIICAAAATEVPSIEVCWLSPCRMFAILAAWAVEMVEAPPIGGPIVVVFINGGGGGAARAMIPHLSKSVYWTNVGLAGPIFS